MLFINPPSGLNQDIPNMGLAYASAHFNTKVIDLNTKPVPWSRFLDIKTSCIGISVKSLTYKVSKEIITAYKKKYPKTKIKSITGFVDVQCCYPFLEFKSKIMYKYPFSDKYPFPKYELFDSFDIFQKKWQTNEWKFPLMTSLGCPHQCIYCTSKNRKWHTRSIQNCLEELEIAKKKYGIKSFQVVDDCFNVKKERVLEFCEAVQHLNLEWFCTNGLRADQFDKDMAAALKQAGCKNVSFGIESIDDNILKSIKKGENRKQIEKAVRIAKKFFKHVNGFFILGLPSSTYQTDLKAFKWSVKNRINAHFSYYVPFDEGLQYDQIFYGNNAHPVSKAYPLELQKRLYESTGFMRCDCSCTKVEKILKRIKFIWKFDKLHFPQQIFEWSLKIF